MIKYQISFILHLRRHFFCKHVYIDIVISGEERELRLSETNFQKAASLLRRVPEFTMVAILRQEEANSGTIVAFSHGNNRYNNFGSIHRNHMNKLHNWCS